MVPGRVHTEAPPQSVIDRFRPLPFYLVPHLTWPRGSYLHFSHFLQFSFSFATNISLHGFTWTDACGPWYLSSFSESFYLVGSGSDSGSSSRAFGILLTTRLARLTFVGCYPSSVEPFSLCICMAGGVGVGGWVRSHCLRFSILSCRLRRFS